jgi:hypothetical protein
MKQQAFFPAEDMEWPPCHKTAKNDVTEPTIKCQKDGTIVVQWYGQSHRLPGGVSQFFFPLWVPKNDIQFTMLSEFFRVPFLAPAKSWPAADEVVQMMIDGPAEGDPDCFLIWAINPAITMRGEEIVPRNSRQRTLEEGDRPHSPCAKVVLLGDPNVGVIAPKAHIDLRIRDQALGR